MERLNRLWKGLTGYGKVKQVKKYYIKIITRFQQPA
jgi:hypothetical protein